MSVRHYRPPWAEHLDLHLGVAARRRSRVPQVCTGGSSTCVCLPCALFLIQRRWMVDSDGARPDDDEYDRLDYIRSVLDDQQCAHRSTIGLQDISNEGTRSEELWPIFFKSILNILTCAHDNQHVRLFLSTKRERERMMVIFYNPTSIHLSRAGWIMRKSCGLGHRRY